MQSKGDTMLSKYGDTPQCTLMVNSFSCSFLILLRNTPSTTNPSILFQFASENNHEHENLCIKFAISLVGIVLSDPQVTHSFSKVQIQMVKYRLEWYDDDDVINNQTVVHLLLLDSEQLLD